jgi:hypothetical protein
MLDARGCHGCSRTTINGYDCLVVFGGNSDGPTHLTTIHFYNLAKQVWESYPSTISLPTALGGFLGVLNLQMDENGCDTMLVTTWPSLQLLICKNKFEWTTPIDLTGKIDMEKTLVAIGSTELTPC